MSNPTYDFSRQNLNFVQSLKISITKKARKKCEFWKYFFYQYVFCNFLTNSPSFAWFAYPFSFWLLPPIFFFYQLFYFKKKSYVSALLHCLICCFRFSSHGTFGICFLKNYFFIYGCTYFLGLGFIFYDFIILNFKYILTKKPCLLMTTWQRPLSSTFQLILHLHIIPFFIWIIILYFFSIGFCFFLVNFYISHFQQRIF